MQLQRIPGREKGPRATHVTTGRGFLPFLPLHLTTSTPVCRAQPAQKKIKKIKKLTWQSQSRLKLIPRRSRDPTSHYAPPARLDFPPNPPGSSRSKSSAGNARGGAPAAAAAGGRELLGGRPAAAGEAAAAAAPPEGVAAPARAAGLGRPRGLLLRHELVDVLPPPGPRSAPALPAAPPPAPRGRRRPQQLVALDSGNLERGLL